MRATINRYFEEVGRCPLPTAESERTSFRRYAVLREKEASTTDPQERRRINGERTALGGRIVSGYLRFVIGKARDYTRDRDTLLQELVSAGNIGLMIALDKFDVERGFKFLTYASWWVRVEMNKVIHSRKQVHPSIHGRKQAQTEVEEGGSEEPIVDAIMTPIDDVQLDAGVDVEADVHTGGGRLALRYLHAAGLGLRARFILTLALGLRGHEHSDDEIALILYGLDGSLLAPSEIRGLREAALTQLRTWVAEDATEDVLAELAG